MTLDWERLTRATMHPTRVRILEQMAASAEPASPAALSRDGLADVSLGAISYHVRALEAAGLIELASTRPRRGALEHFYRLTAAESAR